MVSFLNNLENKQGESINAEDALKGKIVALYFSSSWCPACKAFTPLLSVLHEEAQEEDLDFEVIYVSSDSSAAQCDRYMKEKHGNWLRIAFDSANDLKKKYGVFAGREQGIFPGIKRRSGIPTLVVVDQSGSELELLDCDSYSVIRQIESMGTSFLDRWKEYKW